MAAPCSASSEVLWQRRAPPTSQSHHARAAVPAHRARRRFGLIDGIGNKENEKFIDIYGVDNAGQGAGQVEDALASWPRPDDIAGDHTTSFDHAGGDNGSIRREVASHFQSRYVVQKGELDSRTIQ